MTRGFPLNQNNDLTHSGFDQSHTHVLDQSDTNMAIDGPSFSDNAREKPEVINLNSVVSTTENNETAYISTIR